MGVKVLDDYYLGITAIVTVVYQLFFFSIAFYFKFDKLTDFAGGTNFALLALLTLILAGLNPSITPSSTTLSARQILASLCLLLWSLRLALFLAYRVHKTGKDNRFDDKRNSFFPFLGFWIFQMIWVFTVSLPVTILNSPAIQDQFSPQPSFGKARDVLGLLMWLVGWTLEAVGDWQRFQFRESNTERGSWCEKGVWKWSRHPNYFGEILVQFGIYTMCVTPAFHGVMGGGAAALNASIVGPILLAVLLMFVSGMTLSERPGAKKRWEVGGETWRGYQGYLERTSILVPMPRKWWKALPIGVKRTVGMEWGIYRFDPEVHGGGGKGNGGVEQGRVEGERHSGEAGLVAT